MTHTPLPSQPNDAGDAPPAQVVTASGGSTIRDVTQVIAEKYYSRSQAEELSDYLARVQTAQGKP